MTDPSASERRHDASGRPVLVRAAAVVDAGAIDARPGAVLLADGGIVAAGPPSSIGVPHDARVVERPGHVLIPALVDAHAHLDLTHLGPRPFEGSFTRWIDAIRAGRATDDAALRRSVERGVELALAGGTGLVGDIAGAGSTVPLASLRGSPLGGVSFLEWFGSGAAEDAAIARLRETIATLTGDDAGVRLGVQPHAPYSCGPALYAAAAALGVPMATHLAETPEELRFVADRTGPIAEMLARFGVAPGGEPAGAVVTGEHPLDVVLQAIGAVPCIAAHCNYLEPRHVEQVARSLVTVAYCPRASAYFGHPRDAHRPHPYQELLDAGGAVALGTDSIVCLDTPDRLSILDEMRHLWRRDRTAPRRLLEMATVAGATALGADPARFTLAPGPTAGLLAVSTRDAADPLAGALRDDGAPEWAYRPTPT